MPNSAIGHSHNQKPGESPWDLTITRTVTVKSPSGRPSLELEAKGDDVMVTVLPRNGSKREPVKLVTLRQAIDALGGDR
jgi:hypothetical protein